MSLSRFFVHRPIFAWVIALVIMLAGVGSILRLPIAQYPDIAPPTVQISATYPGASAETLQNSVTQIIEQQLIGIDNMLYFSSTSDSAGKVSISVTFDRGTNPDIAQVQVQNKVQQGMSRLPAQVQEQGVSVVKAAGDNLLVLAMYDAKNRSSDSDISDYLVTHFQDPLARVNGVGQLQIIGTQYAMRIWVDPARLAARQLIPSDVQSAVAAQNADVAAGQIGAVPIIKGQQLNAVVLARSRLETPDQFRAIVVKTNSDGSVVRLSDVARVELGQEDYSLEGVLNGHPASGIAVRLSPGADALKTADAVKARVAQLSRVLPAGYAIAYPSDATDVVTRSVHEVVETLLIAIVLVVVVMYIFLQSWRATLIPAVAVPVVLLGTFGVLALFGYSINTMTLFGMVLAIGLLVDDAIVVVENVERIMEEEGLDPVAATVKSMGEIGSALVAIALVLSTVLLPMAFFGGSTGVIYRQFSVTIVSAMALSVVVALVLSPALCAAALKPGAHHGHDNSTAFGRFNLWFARQTDHYVGGAARVIHRRGLFLLVYGGLIAVLALLFLRLPTSFIPNEDQGKMTVSISLPAGATFARTDQARRFVEGYFFKHEPKNMQVQFANLGTGPAGSGQNAAMEFDSLAGFDDRKGAYNEITAIIARANTAFKPYRDAKLIALNSPPIHGLGSASGFSFQLLNSGGLPYDQFLALRDKLVAAADKDPRLSAIRVSSLPDAPQMRVDFDDAKLASMGLTATDANATLAYAWGGTYIGDFVDRGRVKKVYIEGDAGYRMNPDDLSRWFLRSTLTTADGLPGMVPFSSFAAKHWLKGPNVLARFNGVASFEIDGDAGPGTSSGEAMAEMVRLQQQLAPGTDYAWSGLSFQENQATGQAIYLYGLSLLVVFLCLAALYESWSVPLAVLMVVPLGVIGAVLAVAVRGLENNIYFQVGLLTTIGLAAKNAILIVEFAEAVRARGANARDAVLQAARVRLRPILMTSIAFVAGVFPLAIATGAGAQSRIAIGTAVLGGMITATALAIFYVPLCFVVIDRIFHRRLPEDK